MSTQQPDGPPLTPVRFASPPINRHTSNESIGSDPTTATTPRIVEPTPEFPERRARQQSFSFGPFRLSVSNDKNSDKASSTSSGGKSEEKKEEKKKLFSKPWKKDRPNASGPPSPGFLAPIVNDNPGLEKPIPGRPTSPTNSLRPPMASRAPSNVSVAQDLLNMDRQHQADSYAPSEVSRFRESVTAAEATVDRLTTINSALSGIAAIATAAAVVPLLGESFRFCVQMLEQAKKISLGKVAALRLVERCASVLAGVEQAIIDNHGRISPIMQANIVELCRNLRLTAQLLTRLSNRSFLKLYLHADDVARQIDKASHDLHDSITIFSLQSFVEVSAWEQQSVLDHARDLEMLFHKLDEAREDEKAMLKILSMKSEEQAEAIKTLQRTLNSILAGGQRESGSPSTQTFSPTDSLDLNDSPNLAPHLIQLPIQTRFASNTKHASATPVSPPLRKKRSQTSTSAESAVSWASVGALASSQATQPSLTNSSLALSMQGQDSQDSTATQDWHSEEGHRQFCELALNVLRRNSSSSDQVVPDWTITKLEVSHDTRISSGFYSVVYRGRWQNRSVAIKELNAMADKTLFIKEVNVWRQLRSPFILPFLGASSATGPPPWFLVSPYMENGNILSYLRSSGKHADRVALSYHMAQGMEYLHSRDIIHGDLKGANVLVDDVGNAVICDFGLSQLKLDITTRSQDGAGSQRAKAGTLRWQSPERLAGGMLTVYCDVYAFAMTVFEIYSGEVPFGHVDDLVVRTKVANGERPPRPKEMPSALWTLVEQCWHQNQTKRPRFEEIVVRMGKLHVTPDRQSSVATQATASSSTESSYHTPTEADDAQDGVQQAISPDPFYLPLPGPAITDINSSPSSPGSPPANLEDQASFGPQRAERYYRHHLHHHFDDRLTLPLWFPAPVALGSVGYMKQGEFVHLLDATMPPMGFSSLPPMPKLSEFETLQTIKSSVNVRSAAERGIDRVSSWASFIRSNGDRLERAVSRRITFSLEPGSRQATLIVDDGQFEIYRSFAEAKAYLQANIDWILAEFGERENIFKADVMLVVGTLTARNYAIWVSNFSPRTTVTFNVHSKQEIGLPWGTWSVRRASLSGLENTNPPEHAAMSSMSAANASKTGTTASNTGPNAVDSDQQQLKYSCKVSKALASPMDAVILARFKFVTEASEPALFP